MAEDQQNRGEALMTWTFPEFVKHDRGRNWYLWFVGLVALVLAYAVWSANYTFAAVIVLATFILVVRLRRMPPKVNFAVHENGIVVSERFYEWREIKEFFIIYQPPAVKKLFFEFKGSLRPAMEISLEQQNPVKLRQVLNEFLLENIKREEEPLADQWSRALKI